MTDCIEVVKMLAGGDIPGADGYWWGLDETACPQYKGRPITEGEMAVLKEAEIFD